MTAITLILASAACSGIRPTGLAGRHRPRRAGPDAARAVDRAAARAPAAAAAARSAARAARTAAPRDHRRHDGLDHGDDHDGYVDHRDDARDDDSSVGQHVKWTVKPGDTLASIATQFGTTVRALYA